MEPQWSVRKAFLVLGGSLLTTLVLSFTGRFFIQNWQAERKSDPRYHLTSIIQTGPEKEALKTVYLAELLGLSIDR